MKINGNTIEFTDEHPQKEGTFLWKNSLGVEIIKVVHYPEKEEYGIDWDAYYGIPNMRKRNVEKLTGQFCEIEMED